MQASRLLSNDKVWNEVEKRRQKLYARHEMTAERVRLEWMAIAFLDPATFYDADGNLLPIPQMPPEARRALAGMDVEELYDYEHGQKTPRGLLRKIRFPYKLAALQALAKDLGMLREGTSVNVNVDARGRDFEQIPLETVHKIMEGGEVVFDHEGPDVLEGSRGSRNSPASQ